MKCERVEELLIDYLHGEIELGDIRSVEVHLESCHSCSVKLSEFKDIRSAFQSETLPELSSNLLEPLTTHAEKELKKDKVSFWKKWFYTPILVPTLTTAIALMVWVNYSGDKHSEFGDEPEFYSHDVMAEKIPAEAMVEGQGNFRAGDEDSGRILNAELPSAAVIPNTEQRTDIAAAPSVRDEFSNRHYEAEAEFDTKGKDTAGRLASGQLDEQSNEEQRQAVLDNLKKEAIVNENRAIVKDGASGSDNLAPKPQAPPDDNKLDDDGFRFSFGSSKVMTKKMPQTSANVIKEESGSISARDVVEKVDENKEDQEADLAARAKMSEQVRSVEKTGGIPESKLEDERLKRIDTPQEIADKTALRQLNVALGQQKMGDCESAIATNEMNLKNSPDAPGVIKEQTYLSLAQCYEQRNMYAKAIENYNNLQQVAPSQKAFAMQKIQELNIKVQQYDIPAASGESPSGTSIETEAVK